MQVDKQDSFSKNDDTICDHLHYDVVIAPERGKNLKDTFVHDNKITSLVLLKLRELPLTKL